MKKITFALLLGLIYSLAIGQKKVELNLKLVNKDTPVSLINVLLTDISDNSTMQATTNRKGEVKFGVLREHKYIIGVPENDSIGSVEIPRTGMSFLVKTVNYSPENALAEGLQNNNSERDTIYQEISDKDKVSYSEAMVITKVVDANNRGLTNTEVRIFTKEYNKVFITSTDAFGEAKFIVPNGTGYIMGIRLFNNFHTFKVPASPVRMTQVVKYQPTEIDEVNTNDTIRQTLSANPKPTTESALVLFHIVDLNREDLPDENIFCNVVGDSIVYCATTDFQGRAAMLLPKGKDYNLNFKYERDIDLLQYPMQPGFHKTEIDYVYIGSRTIEEHYETTQRDKNGFMTEFIESTVTPISFNQELFERTENGFNINFERQNTSPPLFAEDKVFVSGGYYNRDFYAFDADRGDFRWGVALSENGASSAIYSEGVLLLITQSCTLYALDAGNGNLLWSKWLGPNLYSSPTVANGKVYAVYPDEVREGFYQLPEPFVLVAFNLQSGKVEWQNRIDSEVLAAPVVADEAVYLTTHKGSLYKFSTTDGKQSAVLKNAKAVSPPTVVDDKLYVCIRNKKDSTLQTVNLMSSSALSKLKEFSQLSSAAPYNHAHDLSASKLMSFSGGRITHYQGLNYNIVGNDVVCSNPESGAVVWKHEVAKDTIQTKNTPQALMPTVVGDRVVVSTAIGTIHIFDAQSGKLIQNIETGVRLYTQAVVHNGWIYTGSSDGKFISYNTKNQALTGWTSWSKDGGHNPVVKKQ